MLCQKRQQVNIKMYKMMKVFDCQDMPIDIRNILFELHRDRVNNDSIIDYTIAIYNNTPELDAIDKWLIENGADATANPGIHGETVLIKYWW